ncbi:hypothetical protein JR316_0012337 [Psilocybe cubensis]|uniref:Uncharacterized protein n=1 Tax=Psilocybe cubensis TaxID=181762 RepID=A0ACB8GJ39_PSICU|nr:hypothetical protein JR316_0012337 [Psilocybe cubensis]KAH9475226.1 hypothetical protein JR316_0012337 [Psilocybe cubensis]
MNSSSLRILYHTPCLTKLPANGVLTNKPIVKPVLPFSFGYKKTHSSRSKALFAIEQSRNWFVVWMALLAYLVAQARGKPEQDTEQTDLLSYLASKGCNTAWLEAFSLSGVFDFADGTRAGTFVDAQKRAYSQPSIEWLCEFGVPVWYIWYPEYNEITQMKGLSPPCHEVQSVATIIFTSPSAHSSLFNSPKSLGESWQEFFAAREERNKRTQAAETHHQRQCRLNRKKNPPQTAKVFEWVKDISGTLVREPVAQRERAGRMAIYAKDQIRYDSFANEYDCCEEFGPGFKQWRSLEEGKMDYDVLSTFDNEVILSEMLKGIPTSLSVAIENDDVSEWLPRHVLPARGQSISDRAEEEILETLRLYCGFTPPLPCPDGTPISSIADQHNFLKFIGIPWKSCPVDIFAKPRIIAAVGFVRRLSIQSAIPDDQWDLNRCHTEYLGHSVRFKSLRIVRQVTDRSKMFYMFDFEPHNTDEWKLTMTSASDAMLNGVPFYTVRLSDSLQPTPSKNRHHLQPAVEYPYRSAGYQFTIDDYAVYIERTTRLLSGPMGRIALMKGGYLWRLAVTVVSFESVLTGPVVRSDEELLVVTDSEEQYCDNELTPQELEILSGVYHCHTGQGNQIAKRSWYPTPQKHEYPGQGYGRWTSNSESNLSKKLYLATKLDGEYVCLLIEYKLPLPGGIKLG